MQSRLRFEYEVGVPIGKVKEFFRDVSNLERVWPKEFALRVVEGPKRVEAGAEYSVGGRLLGQPVTLRFKVLEETDTTSLHVLEDVLGARLEHSQKLESSGGGTRVVEEFVLSANPLLMPAARLVLKRALEYRVEAIKALLEGGRKPVYRDPLKLSVPRGTALSLLALLAAFFLTVWTFERPIDYIAKLIAWFVLWFFTHDLAHLVVGAIAGLRFSHYYVGLSNMVRAGWFPKSIRPFVVALGIKIDRERSKAGRLGYFAMYLAGPLASMISPFAVPLYLLATGRTGLFAFLMLALSIANVAFSLPLSSRVGCVAKAFRALRRR
ncbi:MAG: SRPBCC family protein [Aigarchaeota archaeon]|nr:SRPBCC family protein [Candidatus Calditenuis fumarioli]